MSIQSLIKLLQFSLKKGYFCEFTSPLWCRITIMWANYISRNVSKLFLWIQGKSVKVTSLKLVRVRSQSCSNKCFNWPPEKQQKTPWTEEEKAAVNKHLGRYLILNKVPGKAAIDKCVEAEACLRHRQWRNKDYCRNTMKSKARGTPFYGQSKKTPSSQEEKSKELPWRAIDGMALKCMVTLLFL